MTAAATCDARIRVAVVHRSPCIAAGIEAVLGAQAGSAGVLVADHATALQVLEDPLRSARAARPVLVVAESHRTWQVRSAIGAGARGYLGMDCTAEELQVAVRRVAEGRRYLSVGVADQLLDDLARGAPTPRELDVLRLLVRGLDNRGIARRLGIAEGTVRARGRSVLGRIAGPDGAPRLARALRRGALLAADAAPGAAMPGLRTATRRPAIAVRVHHRDALLMAGLRALVGREPGMTLHAGPGGADVPVDVVVCDPDHASNRPAAAPGGRAPRIVVVARSDADVNVRRVIDGGAHGLLFQDASARELLDGIAAVARGGSGAFCGRAVRLLAACPRRGGLTAREEDLLRRHMADGQDAPAACMAGACAGAIDAAPPRRGPLPLGVMA